MVYETVTDWEYQQKCTTQYEKKCHGYGYHQVDWKMSNFVKWLRLPPGVRERAQGDLQAGAQEGGAPGAAHKVQERAGQEVPRRADQRAKEGVQRVS